MKKRPTIGLALGSGGGKGFTHIGIIKTLVKHNIPIDYIAGTSIGALVGAYYAAHNDAERLKKTSLSTNWKTGLKLFDIAWKGGIIKGKKIEKLINTWLEGANFDSLQIPLTVITTDLESGKEHDISKGNLTEAVRASISIPGIFQPVLKKDKILVDGGISNPVPDDIVKNMGADIVIAVNLDNEPIDKTFTKAKPTLPKISVRTVNVMRYHLAKNGIRTADIIMKPRTELIGIVGWNKFFNADQALKAIKEGEKEAEKHIPRIKKLIESNQQ